MTWLLLIIAAVWLPSAVLIGWLWWAEVRRHRRRREWDAETAEALAVADDSQSRGRHPSSRPTGQRTWQCPWCPDQITARVEDELWEAATDHLAGLCQFYRLSGSWDVAGR